MRSDFSLKTFPHQQDFFPITSVTKSSTARTALLMGSELRCQNFDLVKFRQMIPRNLCYGTFFCRNFEPEFSKSSDPPAEPKLESELWANSDPSSVGLTSSRKQTDYTSKHTATSCLLKLGNGHEQPRRQ